MHYQNPILTVDVVILTLHDGRLQVALMTRTEDPFAGRAVLPGGYVHGDPRTGHVDASTTHAALRILKQKLGFTPSHLEQVYTASGPKRDPRGWSASVVYLALHEPSAVDALIQAGAVSLHAVHPTPALPPLAFDHTELIQTALARLQAKARYSTIVAHLLPPVFRLSDLRQAYELVCGTTENKANFRRKMLAADALVATDVRIGAVGRPAEGYRLRGDLAYIEGLISGG
ncbi:MAG: NUDIX hydrolase [Roseateles sp.]|uniref:NUDIX hydrolase n=1 Tax=Roseateles sp. TaxID=1971397 RepID=UPI0039E883DD